MIDLSEIAQLNAETLAALRETRELLTVVAALNARTLRRLTEVRERLQRMQQQLQQQVVVEDRS